MIAKIPKILQCWVEFVIFREWIKICRKFQSLFSLTQFQKFSHISLIHFILSFCFVSFSFLSFFVKHRIRTKCQNRCQSWSTLRCINESHSYCHSNNVFVVAVIETEQSKTWGTDTIAIIRRCKCRNGQKCCRWTRRTTIAIFIVIAIITVALKSCKCGNNNSNNYNTSLCEQHW